jgi:ABC-type transport system involved in multi-copper enzyme maturation permease subunit
MIWLTWRQFRGQALTAFAALGALTVYLVILGLRIRHSYEVNVNCTGCSVSAARDILENDFSDPLLLTGFLVVLVPGLIGAFWGAPLIAREIETGTHRLVWNQSVTRTRWLAVKLAFVVLAGVVLTGALCLLLTWAAGPYDRLLGGRFDPLVFPTRDIVSVGYAVFAIVGGTAVGLLTRRTVPAMAITLAVFAALQILLPTAIRPHLQTPVTETVAFNADITVQHFGISEEGNGGVSIGGYANTIPGAWILSDNSPLFDAAGNQVTREQISSCMTGDFRKDMACVAGQDLHFAVTYQPADRYWTFQWLEFAMYVILAGLLAGFTFWRIPRGLS